MNLYIFFKLIKVNYLTITLIFYKFIYKFSLDTITLKKIIFVTLNLHFLILIYKLAYFNYIRIKLTCFLCFFLV